MYADFAGVPAIRPEELKKRLAGGADLVLLDVRRPDEHNERNIPNSLLIPLGELQHRIVELEPYREREIIVYCRSGIRSAHACSYLREHGFRATNLAGGILTW